MDDYFEREIKQTKREIVQLKTSTQRSAGVVPMISETMNINIPLELNASQTSSTGERMYRIITNKTALIIPTLDWYFDDIMENNHYPYISRYADVNMAIDDGENHIIKVNVRGNQTDTQAIISGGSVSISVKLTIQCSDSFSVRAI